MSERVRNRCSLGLAAGLCPSCRKSLEQAHCFIRDVLLFGPYSAAPTSTNTTSNPSQCRSICRVVHPIQCPYFAWARWEAQESLVTELHRVPLPEVVAVVAAAIHVYEVCDVAVWCWRNTFAADDNVDVFLYRPRCEKEESSVDVSPLSLITTGETYRAIVVDVCEEKLVDVDIFTRMLEASINVTKIFLSVVMHCGSKEVYILKFRRIPSSPRGLAPGV